MLQYITFQSGADIIFWPNMKQGSSKIKYNGLFALNIIRSHINIQLILKTSRNVWNQFSCQRLQTKNTPWSIRPHLTAMEVIWRSHQQMPVFRYQEGQFKTAKQSRLLCLFTGVEIIRFWKQASLRLDQPYVVNQMGISSWNQSSLLYHIRHTTLRQRMSPFGLKRQMVNISVLKMTQTNKQTNKHTNKRPNKQTNTKQNKQKSKTKQKTKTTLTEVVVGCSTMSSH